MHTQRSSIGSFDLATDESSGLIILVEFTGFLSVSVKDRVALNCSVFWATSRANPEQRSYYLNFNLLVEENISVVPKRAIFSLELLEKNIFMTN